MVFPSLTSGVEEPEGATPTGKLCMKLNQRTWARATRYLTPLTSVAQKTRAEFSGARQGLFSSETPEACSQAPPSCFSVTASVEAMLAKGWIVASGVRQNWCEEFLDTEEVMMSRLCSVV